MKLTKIETQRNPNRVNIYIDGEFAFGLDKELIFKHSLKRNQTLTEDFLNNILIEEEKRKVIHSALNYISYRPRSEKELRENLESKDFNPEDIDEAIEYCIDKDYLNDREFAKSFIRDKINLNKHGSYRIKYELHQKGVSDSIINELLNNEDDDTEYNRALEVAEKKVYSYRKDDYQQKYRKLGGFLQRRGYPFPIISKVLKEVLDD